jgi:MFS family permease
MLVLLVPLHLWALRGADGLVPPAAAPAEDPATLREALRTPAFWLLTLCFTGNAIVVAAFWAHVMPLLASKGLDEARSLAVLVWVGPAQVLGRWLLARHGAGLSLRSLGIAALAAIPVSLVMFALSASTPALVASAWVYGLANGLLTIVRGALLPEYFGRAHLGRIGGAMSGIALVARAVGPLGIAGWLLWVPGYDGALVLLALVGVLSAAAFAAARRP